MKLEHITKKYGSNVVLNDIDFDFGIVELSDY